MVAGFAFHRFRVQTLRAELKLSQKNQHGGMLGIMYTDDFDTNTQDLKQKLGTSDSSVQEAMVSA